MMSHRHIQGNMWLLTDNMSSKWMCLYISQSKKLGALPIFWARTVQSFCPLSKLLKEQFGKAWAIFNVVKGEVGVINQVSQLLCPALKESTGHAPICYLRLDNWRHCENRESVLWAHILYSRLPLTQTLANSNVALTQTKIDFPWISVIHSL